MAKNCFNCGRGAVSAQSRSHSNIATKRRQGVNLQNRRIEGQRVKICTSCLKTRTKQLAQT